MQFLQSLSSRGVDLYEHHGELQVIRHMTTEKLHRILSFYQEVDFAFRPSLIDTDNKTQYGETFIPGDLLMRPNHDEIITVAKTIVNLSNYILQSRDITEYMTLLLESKVKKRNLTDKERSMALVLGKQLIQNARQGSITLHWTHGDLKGDNIIMQEGYSYFIDWESVKEGFFLEDVQKFIHTTLWYQKEATDNFLNTVLKYKTIDWDTFVLLEAFYFFLNQLLQYSKKRITQETFRRTVDEKIDAMTSGSIYRVSNQGRTISIGSITPISPIFEANKEISAHQMPEHTMLAPNMNNQEQRLEINKALMLKTKDFLVLQGIVFRHINGKNILLWGRSEAGKYSILEALRQMGVVATLLDENPINIDTSGQLFSLWKRAFTRKQGDHYDDKTNPQEPIGHLDMIIYIDPANDSGCMPIAINQEDILKYLIPERYQEHTDLLEYYRNFTIDPSIHAFVYWNNHPHLNSLLDVLWSPLSSSTIPA